MFGDYNPGHGSRRGDTRLHRIFDTRPRRGSHVTPERPTSTDNVNVQAWHTIPLDLTGLLSCILVPDPVVVQFAGELRLYISEFHAKSLRRRNLCRISIDLAHMLLHVISHGRRLALRNLNKMDELRYSLPYKASRAQKWLHRKTMEAGQHVYKCMPQNHLPHPRPTRPPVHSVCMPTSGSPLIGWALSCYRTANLGTAMTLCFSPPSMPLYT